MEPDAVLEGLLAGNRRFAAGQALHPHQDPARRAAVAPAQAPFAAVVGCSDSRVPPELIFDFGLGDLFVVRAAGHVLEGAGLASVEYAVEHFDISLVLVLGHSNCGAVAAAISGDYFPGNSGSLVGALRASVVEAQFQPGDLHANATRANTLRTVRQLRSSSLSLTKPAREGRLRVVGGYYDLSTGAVEILGK